MPQSKIAKISLKLRILAFYCSFLQFLAAVWISKINCAEIRDRPGQSAYDIFSIKRTVLTFWVSMFQVQEVFPTEISNYRTLPVIILLHAFRR